MSELGLKRSYILTVARILIFCLICSLGACYYLMYNEEPWIKYGKLSDERKEELLCDDAFRKSVLALDHMVSQFSNDGTVGKIEEIVYAKTYTDFVAITPKNQSTYHFVYNDGAFEYIYYSEYEDYIGENAATITYDGTTLDFLLEKVTDGTVANWRQVHFKNYATYSDTIELIEALKEDAMIGRVTKICAFRSGDIYSTVFRVYFGPEEIRCYGMNNRIFYSLNSDYTDNYNMNNAHVYNLNDINTILSERENRN